jgi:hypothetical protein
MLPDFECATSLMRTEGLTLIRANDEKIFKAVDEAGAVCRVSRRALADPVAPGRARLLFAGLCLCEGKPDSARVVSLFARLPEACGLRAELS